MSRHRSLAVFLCISARYRVRVIKINTRRRSAEYIQVKNRYEGLKGMIEKWDAHNLPFVPTCPRETYNFQLRAMKDYMDILVVRAKIEGINL